MDSLRMCSGCSRVFCFIDSTQEECIHCGAPLRPLTEEETLLVLKTMDGKLVGGCGCSSGKSCSC